MSSLGRSLFAAAIAVAALAPSAAQATRIAVITHGAAGDAYWTVVKNGVDAAAERMGADVEYRAPETFDMVAMAQLIDAAVASEVDGLVVSIPDADALGDSIRAAVAAGIPVISIDSGQEVSHELGAMMHLGQSEYDAGVAAGERLAAAGVTDGLCVNHEVGNVGLDLRCQGFADGLGGPVEVLAVGTDPQETGSRLTAFLGEHPEIDGILALGPVGAEPLLAALEEGDMTGRYTVGTFDLSPTTLQAIQDGKMLFAIDTQQYLLGYLPVVMLSLYHDYKLMPSTDIMTGPGFVTRETAGDVMELSRQGIR